MPGRLLELVRSRPPSRTRRGTRPGRRSRADGHQAHDVHRREARQAGPAHRTPAAVGQRRRPGSRTGSPPPPRSPGGGPAVADPPPPATRSTRVRSSTESTPSSQAKAATARWTLFDWRWPMRCHSASGRRRDLGLALLDPVLPEPAQPGGDGGSTTSGPKPFVTATTRTSAGSRSAAPAASSIRRRTATHRAPMAADRTGHRSRAGRTTSPGRGRGSSVSG